MHIGLDAFAAVGKGGNSTYSRQLIRHLLRQDSPNQYYLFGYAHDVLRPLFKEPGARAYREVPVRLSASYFPLPRLEQINDVLLRFAARARGVEVFHFTNPISVIEGPFKKVVTIHDLAPFHDASWTKPEAGQAFKKLAPLMMSSDAIIAVSEATKRDIVERFSIDPQRITVIYEGASEEYYPERDDAALQSLVGGPYVLCVGQLQPRKNNAALINAFARIAPHYPDLRLVLAGRAVNEGYLRSLHDMARAAGVYERVVFIPAADNATLRKLYTGAECLAYPSLFEGFGLPVLESLQCGTPVIASSTSSLPEVVGDAGLLVDPTSVEDIAGALERYMSDQDLRGRLRAAIPVQVAKFSWDKAAKETLTVYETLR